jgi:type I restriction enzyme R subunit
MSEAGYVERPILQWLSGLGSAAPGDRGLGWTYRDEAAMAAFDRPLEDPLVEKLLVAAILRINDHVKTPEQAKLAIKALRTTMDAPDKLTANRETLDRLRDGVSSRPAKARALSSSSHSSLSASNSTTTPPPTSIACRA